VTDRPAHAAPTPVGPLLDEQLERINARLPAVPDEDLDRPDESPSDLQARWEALCAPRWRAAALDTLEAALRAEMAAWLEQLPEGGNLLLLGDVGTGKTWTALAVARHVLPDLRPVRFATTAALLERLRPGGGGEVAHYARAALLVLDDLGAERLTGWGAERVYLVVDERWAHRRPTIVTSNLDPQQIAEQVGLRTWDRLRDGATAVSLAGTSRRRPRGSRSPAAAAYDRPDPKERS